MSVERTIEEPDVGMVSRPDGQYTRVRLSCGHVVELVDVNIYREGQRVQCHRCDKWKGYL